MFINHFAKSNPMSMHQLIDAIVEKHRPTGVALHPPASPAEIIALEKKIGFFLPDEFREFYSICNGFGCDDDMFNVGSLDDILEYQTHYFAHKENLFFLAEYMINAEFWAFKPVWDKQFEIIYESDNLVLTSSLHAFLERYLRGGVYYDEGLLAWSEELKSP